MAVGKIRAGTAGSLDKLKKALKESNGGGKFFDRIAADSEMICRFISEPTDFISFEQHFMEDREPKSFPCNTGDCEGCDEGNQSSKIWVAPVLDVEANRVRALQLSKGVVDSLTKIFERRNTIMDRDIAIIREGSGKEGTKYTVDPLDRRRRDISDLEPPDIIGMIEAQLAEATGAAPVDDDDEDETPPPRRSARRGSVKKAAAKKTVRRPTIADEDDDDDDDNWGRAPGLRRSSKGAAAKKATKKVLKKVAPAKKSLRRR